MWLTAHPCMPCPALPGLAWPCSHAHRAGRVWPPSPRAPADQLRLQWCAGGRSWVWRLGGLLGGEQVEDRAWRGSLLYVHACLHMCLWLAALNCSAWGWVRRKRVLVPLFPVPNIQDSWLLVQARLLSFCSPFPLSCLQITTPCCGRPSGGRSAGRSQRGRRRGRDAGAGAGWVQLLPLPLDVPLNCTLCLLPVGIAMELPYFQPCSVAALTADCLSTPPPGVPASPWRPPPPADFSPGPDGRRHRGLHGHAQGPLSCCPEGVSTAAGAAPSSMP